MNKKHVHVYHTIAPNTMVCVIDETPWIAFVNRLGSYVCIRYFSPRFINLDIFTAPFISLEFFRYRVWISLPLTHFHVLIIKNCIRNRLWKKKGIFSVLYLVWKWSIFFFFFKLLSTSILLLLTYGESFKFQVIFLFE